MAQKKVLFIGETWIVTKFHVKGFDVIPLGDYGDFSGYLKDALEPFNDVAITHIPDHLVINLFPQTIEEISEFDVIIISDCGINTLTLMYKDLCRIPMGVDRVKLISDYVKNGGSFIMVGGGVSFQGFRGIANYHGSAIEEILPVNIMEIDDRIECVEGVKPKIINGNHKILRNISNDWPIFLGYQKVFPKTNSEVLATIGEKEDAFIIIGNSGKGKSMAFTSDFAPHWGTDFVKWKDYGKFWYNTINWLAE